MLIVLGAPGCGTGYCAQLLEALGWKMSKGVEAYHDGVVDKLGWRGKAEKFGVGKHGFQDWWFQRSWDGDTARKAALEGVDGDFLGFSDPRTVLMLRLWEGIFPEARYIFVTRRPAYAVQAMQMRRDWRDSSFYDLGNLWADSQERMFKIHGVGHMGVWDCDRISAEPLFAWEFFKRRERTGDFLGFKPGSKKEYLEKVDMFRRERQEIRADIGISSRCSNLWRSVTGLIDLA